MDELKVTDWIEFGSGREEAPIGDSGGCFNSNLVHKKEEPTTMVWQDYLDIHDVEAYPYLNALKKEIESNNLHISADDHQYRKKVPLFSDGKVGEFTLRSWGDLMAAIYSTKQKPISYVEYYLK